MEALATPGWNWYVFKSTALGAAANRSHGWKILLTHWF